MKLSLSLFALCAVLAASDVQAGRRALLIGINDYSAYRLGTAPSSEVPDRDWPNLTGAVNDVDTLKEMLVLLYGVDQRAIVTLTDRAATRAAILQGLEQLVATAAKDDVVLFYFAGHGSQVKNSLSDERDKLDESIVPADSRLGVRDIRDKGLRTYFNRILDRGARLTVILDNCHSGSGARGLGTGARPRGVKPDPRDIADAVKYGQRPESRGALVLSAAEDVDTAWETRDAEGKFHGAFSWAWMRAMRDASSGEPAVETFYRAQARMRAETPFQNPVIAGNPDAKLAPFLGARIDRRDDRTVVGVGKVRGDETVVLQGGWANGLTVGTELQDPKTATRLKITAVRGLGQSDARVLSGPVPQSGALVEVAGWAAPPGSPLRVSIPAAARPFKSIAAFARSLSEEAAQRGVRWVTNPIDATAPLVLRWGPNEWELLGPGGAIEHVGPDAAAIAAVAKLPAGTSLFVQFPSPAAFVDAAGAEAVGPKEADYILVGRYVSRHLRYAWMRPLVKKTDKRHTGLPLQTRWVDSGALLRDALSRLRRIQAWQTLESPPEARFPYRLQIRRVRDKELVRDDGGVIGEEKYVLLLRGTIPLPAKVKQRYVYAFVIDSHGKSTLLFPPSDSGSVENRFPDSPPKIEIPLEGSAFGASAPYGVDTYVLLSTDEPLPNPSILEWDGVRAPQSQPQTPLEQLLALTASGTRSRSFLAPASWSIERVMVESLPSRATNARR